MRNHRLKTCLHIFLLGWVIIFCYVSYGIAQASSLSIDVRGSLIELKAEDILLMDVLKAISEKTGVSIKSTDLITDSFSGNFTGESIEKCIQQLIGNRNCIMIYGNKENDRVGLTDVWILQGGNSNASGIFSGGNNIPLPPENPMKKYKKEWVEQEFGDSKKLSSQIFVNSTNSPVEDPNEGGIRIEGVQKDSFFEMIGLKEEDVISNVNGQPVPTKQDFIQILQSALKDNPIIKIDRFRNGNFIDPIYVELR